MAILIGSTPSLASSPAAVNPSPPIAFHKGVHISRNPHPLYNVLIYNYLSSLHYAFISTLSTVSSPKTHSKALSHLGWHQAMAEEMNAPHSNGSWDLVHLPLDKSAIGIDGLKACLVVKGYPQVFRLVYGNTFSFLLIEYVCLFISLAAMNH